VSVYRNRECVNCVDGDAAWIVLCVLDISLHSLTIKSSQIPLKFSPKHRYNVAGTEERFMRLKIMFFLICVAIVANLGPVKAQSIKDDVYLAYVQDNIVRLADREGAPIAAPGPTFENLQTANLFWSA